MIIGRKSNSCHGASLFERIARPSTGSLRALLGVLRQAQDDNGGASDDNGGALDDSGNAPRLGRFAPRSGSFDRLRMTMAAPLDLVASRPARGPSTSSG
jgi:hypothetical protein